MSRVSVLAVALVSVSVVAPPAALGQATSHQASQPLDRDAVLAMLSGFEEGPSAAEWRALGPDAVPLLARIAEDRQQLGALRARAVHAASSFTTPAARALLRRAAQAPEPLIAREAALGLGRAFGASALGDIAPLLAHADTMVREAAIRALGAIDTASARARLREHLARESDPVLRRAVETELSTGRPGDGSRPG